jgi:hypothetical protein
MRRTIQISGAVRAIDTLRRKNGELQAKKKKEKLRTH